MSTTCEETSDNPLLIQPKSKKNPVFPKFYPFPISREGNESWNCVIGHLKDLTVEVSEEKNMELLFTMGFFGKGTLSRSTPQTVEQKFRDRKKNSWSKSKRKFNQGDNTVSQSSEGRSNIDDDIPRKRRREDGIEVVLSDNSNDLTEDESDCSSDNVSVTISKPDDKKEMLQLTFEEAFFLSYGLGVLVVKDKDQPLDLMRLWHKFCELHPNKNFPVMYTAYHHFRSKGWIVRSGTKYGTDFALYKDGPPFYHSSYAVVVKSVKEQNLRNVTTGGRPNFTWSSLAGLNRVCSHARKAVILLYVIKPNSISENKISTPFCISQYKLEEVLLQRWVPSEDRSED